MTWSNQRAEARSRLRAPLTLRRALQHFVLLVHSVHQILYTYYYTSTILLSTSIKPNIYTYIHFYT
jgi:hypothetical protein